MTVANELIARSIERDSSHCMIAEAIKATIPNARFITVDLQTIRFSDPEKGLRYTYLTPRRAQLALIDFDQGRVPEAFSIHLANGQVTMAGRYRGKHEGTPTKQRDSGGRFRQQSSADTPAPTASILCGPQPGTGAAIRAWARTRPEWQDIKDKGPIVPALREAYEDAHPGLPARARAAGPARLARNSDRYDKIADVIGGRTPPIGALAAGATGGAEVRTGRRRQFGLRALER